MPTEGTIYDELGVPTVINAMGTKTRLSGTLMRPEAADAMRRASEAYVRISDLQAYASEQIAAVTGAEAGYVASGASACLTLATAASIAGDDFGTMMRLPNTDGVPSEVVMARSHRNGYDHAFRAAGADIVDVGGNDNHLGTGSRNVELWEIADGISEDTAAVAYLAKPDTTPPLEDVVALAHEHNVLVIVDAAAELPPVANLSTFVEQGADLVAFSGGKAIRGPQSTGILAGRSDVMRSVALQHLDMHTAGEVWEPPAAFAPTGEYDGVPRHGIGRGLKVGKEEIVGLLKALELFVKEGDGAVLGEWHARAECIADELSSLPGLTPALQDGEKTKAVTSVAVTFDADAAGQSLASLVRGLREETPRVFVGADDAHNNVFSINPRSLTDDEADYLVERIRANLQEM